MRAATAFLIVAAAALAGCGKPEVGDPIAEMDAYIASIKTDKSVVGWRTRLRAPIQVGFPADRQVYWTLDTNLGRMVFKLRHEVAPLHVSMVIYLTRLGFYDGLTFHRVIQGFMAQGGCPLGTGTGMPGFSLPLEVRPDVKHDRLGVLSTANMTRPNTDGSQFFIMFGPKPMLDGRYSIFGAVVEGLEVVQKFDALGATPRFPGDNEAPKQRLVIEKASVELR